MTFVSLLAHNVCDLQMLHSGNTRLADVSSLRPQSFPGLMNIVPLSALTVCRLKA